MRLPPRDALLVALAAVSLAVIYPRVGAWMVRKQLAERVAPRLGRDVHAGKIDISLGHLVIQRRRHPDGGTGESDVFYRGGSRNPQGQFRS